MIENYNIQVEMFVNVIATILRQCNVKNFARFTVTDTEKCYTEAARAVC